MYKLAKVISITAILVSLLAVNATAKPSISRPYYGGGHHTSSHGGRYAGGTGSSHKGGTYKNARTGNQYGRHK
jgi:hypothetical protein